MELEVGEVALYLVEVLEVEGLFQAAGTVEEVDLAAGLLGLEQVHDVASHGSHSGTAADEDELLVGRSVVRDEELSVRARDDHLVTRLAGEDVGRADSGRHVHEAVLSPVEGRGGDTDVEHDDVALCRVVGHGVGLEGRL